MRFLNSMFQMPSLLPSFHQQTSQGICLQCKILKAETHLYFFFNRFRLIIHNLFSEFKKHFFAVFQVSLWFPCIIIRGVSFPPDFIESFTLQEKPTSFNTIQHSIASASQFLMMSVDIQFCVYKNQDFWSWISFIQNTSSI